MNRNVKIILGILTFLPLVLFVSYMLSFMSSLISTIDGLTSRSRSPSDILMSVQKIFAPLSLTILLTIALLIYYLIDILSLNPKLKQDSSDKLVWVFAVIVGGCVGMIIYFFWKSYQEEGKRQLWSRIM